MDLGGDLSPEPCASALERAEDVVERIELRAFARHHDDEEPRSVGGWRHGLDGEIVQTWVSRVAQG